MERSMKLATNTQSQRCFLGVDQTGAALKGRPRPLQAALIHFPNGQPQLRALELPSLSRSSLLELCRFFDLEFQSLTMVIDSVFGLPARLMGRKNFLRIMASTQNFHGFGAAVAREFFATLQAELPPQTRRHVEELLGAQSVFQTIPFQRNIQTGTFRIWKDLTAEGTNWFHLWPYAITQTDEAKGSRPWLYEGYATLYWKELFGCRRREPARTPWILKEHGVRASTQTISLCRRDPDVADAAILALTGLKLCKDSPPLRPASVPRIFQREGWILGASAQAKIK
jgi:hypothetical protein